MLCPGGGVVGLTCTLRGPRTILEVEYVLEVGQPLEGYRKGVLLDAKDVAYDLCTTCSAGVDAGGIIAGDISLQSHELYKVVCKLL